MSDCTLPSREDRFHRLFQAVNETNAKIVKVGTFKRPHEPDRPQCVFQNVH